MFDIKCNSGWLMSLSGGRIREISKRSAQLPPFVSTASNHTSLKEDFPKNTKITINGILRLFNDHQVDNMHHRPVAIVRNQVSFKLQAAHF